MNDNINGISKAGDTFSYCSGRQFRELSIQKVMDFGRVSFLFKSESSSTVVIQQCDQNKKELPNYGHCR